MARDTSPQCKQCRREGQKLFLKGERCFTDKCGVERRSYPPGEHGRGRLRQSEYRVPRFSDVPPIDIVLLDRPDMPPAGAGETPMITLAPAIANAIFAACGVRIRSLPLIPPDVVPLA